MKKFSFFLSIFFLLSIAFIGCKQNNLTDETDDILPVTFKVDIPSSISNNAVVNKSAKDDVMQGNEIYQHLNNFIKIGEGSAELTEMIMSEIRKYHLNHAMIFSFTSDEDGRVKNVEVIENSEFEGALWQYQLNISDAESVPNTDQGFAMQIFWNRSPIKGISILKPYNINRTENENNPNSMFRIDYSEAGENGYDAQMTVSVAGLPLPVNEPYSVSTLKMFVGRTGELVVIKGNTNHPNATLFTTDEVGFNWAFVAAGDDAENLGTAEVGLPPSTLNSNDRNVILKDYSIKNVFTNRINAWFFQQWGVTPTQTQLDEYLFNTQAPGFFNADGFVIAGNSPTAAYEPLLTAMNALNPYNPSEISNLILNFKFAAVK